MLIVALYSSLSDFYESRFLQEKAQEGAPIEVVAPGASHADIARSELGQYLHAASFEAITFANFIRRLQEAILPDREITITSKSKLFLLLSLAWRKIEHNLANGDYSKCFNLLTDFRSFTLDNTVLEEVMSHYAEEEARVVLALNEFMHQAQLYDEHAMNFMLAQQLRQNSKLAKRAKATTLFWGMSFINAAQVELFSELGEQVDLVFPFPLEVFEQAENLDWIHWIAEKAQIITIPSAQKNRGPSFQAKRFPKAYLGRLVQENKHLIKQADIIIGTRNATVEMWQDFCSKDHYSKLAVGPFAEKVQLLYEKLLTEISQKRNSVYEIEYFLMQEAQRSCLISDFRGLKVIGLFRQVLDDWHGYNSEAFRLNIFELSVFKEVVRLNAPRVSLVKSNEWSNASERFFSLNEDLLRSPKDRVCLAISKQFGSLKASFVEYHESLQRFLIGLGPIRRAELDTRLVTFRLKDFLLQSKEVELLIEEGIDDHDAEWKEFLSNIKYETTASTFQRVSYQTPPQREWKVSSEDLGPLSAAKLQSYMSCPKKFALRYLEKHRLARKLRGQLTLLEEGQLQHEIIQEFLFREKQWDELQFKDFLSAKLHSLDDGKNYSFGRSNRVQLWVELYSKCRQATIFLFKLREQFELSYQFEYPTPSKRNDQISAEGRIDIWSKGSIQFLCDLKRSEGSIPKLNAFKNYDSIQLWFYLSQMDFSEEIDWDKPLVFGYLNLSDQSKSLFFVTDKDLLATFKDLPTYYWDKQELQEAITQYRLLEQEKIHIILNDKNFSPMVSKNQICNFCDYATVCDRGVSL